MKKAVMHFITANQVSLETRQRYGELFISMDVNGDGKLSREEVTNGFKKLMRDEENVQVTDTEVEKFMKIADQDGDGEISFQEFLSAVISQDELISETQLKQAFAMFDEDGDDNITAEELVNVLNFVEGMDLKMAQTIIAKYDKNNDKML